MKATKIDLSADDQTVKKCIELYFPPNSRPFVPREVEKLFPLLFEKGDIEAPQSPDEDEDEKKSVSKSSVDSMMLASNTPEQNKIISQVYHDANSIGQIDQETTLLNTSDQDILFTKKKAPFKRIEIARMKAFQAHWDNLKIQQNKKFEEEKRERDKQVQKAFQSREVMETYMRLLEKECIRCRSGLIGKSPFKNKSMWQVALETAPKDTSSLDVRMQFWWKFCIFAGRTSGVRSNFEMEVALALRELLMNNHPIDQTIFFDVINNVSKDALQCVGPLKLLEFMRVCLKIEQKTFQKTLEQKNVSLLIYNQTILTNMSSELVSLMHEISKMKITVPEPTELIR